MVYDIGIIGAGVAGVFAAYKIAKENSECKTIVFELGRPPLKRRRQLEGWLGALPNSDGKLYLSDSDRVSSLIGTRSTKDANKFVTSTLKNVSDLSSVKDKGPSASLKKKLEKNGYDLFLNDYIQLYTKEIHNLSKLISQFIESSENFTYNFDDEVVSVTKQKGVFCIQTQTKEFKCKKILISVGRSGRRWSGDLFKKLGIIENNDISRYGIRAEMPASALKDLNKSTYTTKVKTYYSMVARDNSSPTLSYVTWVVQGSPDSTGAQSGKNPADLSDISITATWEVSDP